MKKYYIILSILVYQYNFGQVNWVYDMTMAQAMALEQHKLIVVDFSASWCLPCKKMDDDLWFMDKIKKLSKNFILLKIDIDQNKELVQKFDVKEIPLVILIDPSQREIWRKSGYNGASPYLKIFKNIPNHTGNLSEHLVPILQKRHSSIAFLNLALAYQDIGRKINKKNIKFGFLNLSDEYLDTIMNKSKNTNLIQEAELHKIVNSIYSGKTKKAFKKLGNITIKKNDNALIELKHFAIALYHKEKGNIGALEELRKEIVNPKFLAQL